MKKKIQQRTDLALELHERLTEHTDYITKEEETHGDCKVTRIVVHKETPEFPRPPGQYVTLRLPSLAQLPPEPAHIVLLAREINKLIPPFLKPESSILICGLGNEEITPDSLGPQGARCILATRGQYEGMGLRNVCAIAPGVFAKTGIEALEVLEGLIEQLKPGAIIAIDALAAEDFSRLGNTIQLCDTGISPGSGVENARPELSGNTLGVPVIAIGMPTVVDSSDLTAASKDITSPNGFVTPRGIDLLCKRGAKMIGLALNLALQPSLELEDLLSLQE
ncbi:MAG: GPR endopeptidase [Oscillospiraceae bacterium]|nr:GPR endopeptidase [Oscillospiraceae bacterium]